MVHAVDIIHFPVARAMPLLFEEEINWPNGPLTPEQLHLLLEGYKAGRAGGQQDVFICSAFVLELLAFLFVLWIVIKRCCRMPGRTSTTPPPMEVLLEEGLLPARPSAAPPVEEGLRTPVAASGGPVQARANSVVLQTEDDSAERLSDLKDAGAFTFGPEASSLWPLRRRCEEVMLNQFDGQEHASQEHWQLVCATVPLGAARWRLAGRLIYVQLPLLGTVGKLGGGRALFRYLQGIARGHRCTIISSDPSPSEWVSTARWASDAWQKPRLTQGACRFLRSRGCHGLQRLLLFTSDSQQDSSEAGDVAGESSGSSEA